MERLRNAEQFEVGWRREYSLYYGVVAIGAFVSWVWQILRKKTTVRGEGNGRWYAFCPRKGMVDKAQAYIEDQAHYDQAALYREVKDLHRLGRQFVHFAKRMKEHVSTETPDSKLLWYYVEYSKQLSRYCVYLHKSFYWSDVLAKMFERWLIEKVPQHEIARALSYYSKPAANAGVLLIGEYFRRVKGEKKRLRYLEQKFPWLGSTDPFTAPISKKEMIAYIRSFKIPETKSPAPVILHLTQKERLLIKLYQEMLYVKDKRDDYRREAFYYFWPLIQELSRRSAIPVADLAYVRPQEVALISENQFWLRKIIQARKYAYLIEIDTKGERIIEGKKVMRYFVKDIPLAKMVMIQGISGSPGKARGIVQIVKSVEARQHFKAGRILVAVTTNPEYITCMQKASAFVTDEGGITSHAAIVARELKKPCVVGTKIATQIFKDGDRVEVDAYKGIVSKRT